MRCKRIRAALRLAKPLIGEKAFRTENRWWRDQARLLSDLRDAGARLEALDTLRPFLVTRIGTAMTRRLEERFRDQQDARSMRRRRSRRSSARLDKRADDLVPQHRGWRAQDAGGGAGRDLPAGAHGDAPGAGGARSRSCCTNGASRPSIMRCRQG